MAFAWPGFNVDSFIPTVIDVGSLSSSAIKASPLPNGGLRDH